MWKITQDYIDEGQSLGVCSTDCTDTAVLPHRFRMIDGDGVPYYEGLSDDDNSFDPLDDFGTGNGGAASIEYFVQGTWQQL
jgi:hypothetical protein